MSVITMILNYNGKHTEVLLERLVGTQPTHPFAPLQRRHQYQTWVILLEQSCPLLILELGELVGQQTTVMEGKISLLYHSMCWAHFLCQGFLII